MNKAAKRVTVTLGALGAVGVVASAVLVGHGQHGASAAAAASRPSNSRPAAPANGTASRSDQHARQRAAGSGGPRAVMGWSSTIPAGVLQFCAQGDYWARIDIEPVHIPGTYATTRGLMTVYLPPGRDEQRSCTTQEFNTAGQDVDVQMFGYDPVTQRQFWVGHASYNSARGLGLGAEGTSTSPFWWQW